MQRSRLAFLFFFILFLFSLLIVRFYQIQILEGEKWERQAKLQHEHVITEPFRRGTFYSNTTVKPGHPESQVPLVLDVTRFHLHIDPAVIPENFKDQMSSQIARILSLDEEELQKIRMHFDKKSRSRKIQSALDAEQKENIEIWWKIFSKEKKIVRNALYFVETYKRCHPFGPLLGQVLHTVREARDEKTKQAIPTGGLELMFHSHLEGKEGKRFLVRSPKFSLENELLEMPHDGADVYLTINHILQAIAEEEICKGVKKANAKSGFVLMMDPITGEIIALAQYPFFYPSEYRAYFNDPERAEETKVKAFSDCHEPGSTMKPLTAAIALLANEELQKEGKKPIFSPFEVIPTDNGHFPGRLKPIKDPRFHKQLNMYLGIQKSSNIYVAKIADRLTKIMGEKWYSDKLQLFGFGKKTEVEFPSESPGFLPIPGKTYANGAAQWSLPTPYSLAMGYNLLASGIQMAKAYAILANGGYDVKPTLIKEIRNKERILMQPKPIQRKRVLSQSICKEIMKTLIFSTKPGGCGALASVGGYTLGGKSGTTEKLIGSSYSSKMHFSSFIGIVPALNPRFVLYVGIDEPEYRVIPGIGRTHFGGKCAAPVLREIARRSLEFLGITPDDPYGYPHGDPRADPLKEHLGKETLQLKLLYDKLNR